MYRESTGRMLGIASTPPKFLHIRRSYGSPCADVVGSQRIIRRPRLPAWDSSKQSEAIPTNVRWMFRSEFEGVATPPHVSSLGVLTIGCHASRILLTTCAPTLSQTDAPRDYGTRAFRKARLSQTQEERVTPVVDARVHDELTPPPGEGGDARRVARSTNKKTNKKATEKVAAVQNVAAAKTVFACELLAGNKNALYRNPSLGP